MRRIHVGTLNPCKLRAVRTTLSRCFPQDAATIVVAGYDVLSKVPEQPLSEIECLYGAKTRAQKAFQQNPCKYSLGIESGIRPIDTINMRYGLDNTDRYVYMEQTYAALYNGTDYLYGISPAWQIPATWLDLILPKDSYEHRRDLNDIAKLVYPHVDDRIGNTKGILSLETRGQVDRQECIEQAVLMVLSRLTLDDFDRCR